MATFWRKEKICRLFKTLKIYDTAASRKWIKCNRSQCHKHKYAAIIWNFQKILLSRCKSIIWNVFVYELGLWISWFTRYQQSITVDFDASYKPIQLEQSNTKFVSRRPNQLPPSSLWQIKTNAVLLARFSRLMDLFFIKKCIHHSCLVVTE